MAQQLDPTQDTPPPPQHPRRRNIRQSLGSSSSSSDALRLGCRGDSHHHYPITRRMSI